MGAAASAGLERNKQLLADLDSLVARQHHLMETAFKLHDREQLNDATGSNPTFHSEAEVANRRIPPGTCCYAWKQDGNAMQTTAQQGHLFQPRRVYLPHVVYAGPTDEDFEVVVSYTTKSGKEEKDTKVRAVAQPDEQQDFLADIQGDPFTFDLVHTYTVARMTLDMYMRDLKCQKWRWQWDLSLPLGTGHATTSVEGATSVVKPTPLKLLCHAGEQPNAVYHRGKKVVKFYYYTQPAADGGKTPAAAGGKTVYLCRSFDIVAHEIGHAILDSLKPKLYSIHTGQAGALHESFADLTAMFSMLEQMDVCEDVIAETKGDLRRCHKLTAMGAQFAAALSDPSVTKGAAPRDLLYQRQEGEDEQQEVAEVVGVRDANNTLTGKDVRNGKDMYGLANIFTGFIFDCLVDIFAWERNPREEESDGSTLHRVARSLRRMLILSLLECPEVPKFADIAEGMQLVAVRVISRTDPGDIAKYAQIVQEHAKKRYLSAAGGALDNAVPQVGL